MNIIIALGLVIAILWLLRSLLSNSQKARKKQWKTYGLLAIMVLALLAVTKKLHVLGILAAGLIPIARQLAPLALRFAPFLHQQFQRYRFQRPTQPNSTETTQKRTQQTQSEPRDTASITTALFHMQLNTASGRISGSVRQGSHKGQALDSLPLNDLKALYQQARTYSDDSLAVFEAYLQARLGPQWRTEIDESSESSRSHTPSHDTLTTKDAWEILGLAPGSPKDQIVARHKSLIQRLHPDSGGSNYLTVRINQARDHLLKNID